ncbi:MAG TPA: T9SS type A sorting domain-containing protein [Pricia antarctica]|uniref:T9SS type A sorting domain-containing protein n=3 Tax=root TaxID=1 RepID=A0A831VV89_9FLAO|nr:T9SS type A sorting domain-containing protein [Pricia antarctica]
MKSAYLVIAMMTVFSSFGQQDIARKWNEIVLEGIRNDFARPTVHARNLFHISAAMYDAWAVFSKDSKPYLIGNEVHGFNSSFEPFTPFTSNLDSLRQLAISYAAFRLIEHRFGNSPGFIKTTVLAEELFTQELGLDKDFTDTDYSKGSAAALGNYIAAQYIAYGLQDGSNETNRYQNQHYVPVNAALNAVFAGNTTISDPNRWQPLAFEFFEDQSGNITVGDIPTFLGAEWGNVQPFAMTNTNLTSHTKNDNDYLVYYDPGPPPILGNSDAENDLYKWSFSMVAAWSGHLDPAQDVLLDISPNALGNININSFPENFSDYNQFYNFEDGGDTGEGYDENPITGNGYEPQIVNMGDYTRVLAEFWADGPNSETPPGHWFTILNYINDHPQLKKKFNGKGEILDDLEWSIKAYFTLGGAMHDAAVAAWSIKGYYDYIRPISAIRYMAGRGQSSNPDLPNFDALGLELRTGFIELVSENDPLVGDENENLNKIKLWAWRGPDEIENPNVDVAGTGWILAENWWPYQRPTFITPPFAGYVSGHSTFSRAAAEVLTLVTGDAFFPGGIGEFQADRNAFLVFEEGPSEDVVLQWATYRDASDQCSLSRIWGGIHPPADDLKGRLIGEKIGKEAYDFAVQYFNSQEESTLVEITKTTIYPNPTANEVHVVVANHKEPYTLALFDLTGKLILQEQMSELKSLITLDGLPKGLYVLDVSSNGKSEEHLIIKK